MSLDILAYLCIRRILSWYRRFWKSLKTKPKNSGELTPFPSPFWAPSPQPHHRQTGLLREDLVAEEFIKGNLYQRKVQNPTRENLLEAGWHWPGMVRTGQKSSSHSHPCSGEDRNSFSEEPPLRTTKEDFFSPKCVCQVRPDSLGPFQCCFCLAKRILCAKQ